MRKVFYKSDLLPIGIMMGIIATCMLCLTSCQHIDGADDDLTDEGTETVSKLQTKNVKFKITNIQVTPAEWSDDVYDDLTADAKLASKATLSEAGMTDLYVYDGDSVICHQLSTDSDFGTPNIKMTYGRHELAFIATKATADVSTKGTFALDKVKDTFAKYVTLEVSSTTLQQSITLDRAIANVKLTIEDAIPTGVASVKVTVGNYYKALTLPGVTGVKTENYASTTTIPSSYVGAKNVGISTYTLVPTIGTGYTTDVKIDFLNASGTVLYTHSLTDVELLNNQVTNIHGNFFGGSTSSLLSVNADWGTQKDIALP